MQPPQQPVITIQMTAPAYGGESLGRLPDGRVVFVPFTIPGETISIQLVEEKRGHARGTLVDVLEVSPDRVSPECVHFGDCGGCHYQHIEYARQLELKRQIIRDQLERIGGIANPTVMPCVASPNPLYYRNYVQFHLDGSGKLGFYRRDGSQVFPIQECLLPVESLNEVRLLLVFEAIPGIDRVGLRQGDEDDIQLILESSDVDTPELLVEDLPISVIHHSQAGELVLAGSGQLHMRINDQIFQASAGSFFQVNSAVAGLLVEHLLGNLDLDVDQTCLEIYSGVGLFSGFVTQRVGRLVAIESNASACEDFVQNLDMFENVELYEGQAGEILPYIQLKPDIVLVDPPSSGIDRTTIDAIIRLRAPVVVYISCDPATLSRDARRLAAGGYRLRQITPFDMFPQTYHVESLSFWDYTGN